MRLFKELLLVLMMFAAFGLGWTLRVVQDLEQQTVVQSPIDPSCPQGHTCVLKSWDLDTDSELEQ